MASAWLPLVLPTRFKMMPTAISPIALKTRTL